MSVGKGTAPRKIDLESLARGYTEASIRRLGGYAVGKDTAPAIAIEAIKVLLDRGWGKCPQPVKHTGETGKGPVQVELVHRIRGEK